MKISLNHKEIDITGASTLADLLAAHALDGPGYAVAVGGKVVPRSERATFVLTEGMEIIVIKAVCGG